MSGAGFVNQLVKRSDDVATLARVLGEHATGRRYRGNRRGTVTGRLRRDDKIGAYPAPGHCPFFLSYFWALADDDRWPIAWPRSTSFLEYVTGEVLPPEPAARYERYLVLQRDLDPDHWHF